MADVPVSQPAVDVRRPDGTTSGRVELDAATFGITPNVAVLHQVVTAQLAAARSGTQSTLTRAEVQGGGRKPWRQKGTGRARQGSNRAPHWTGGGVALGPKPRDYRQRTPKKMVALALRSALSDRAAEERVVVIDEWRFEQPRTKDGAAVLAALGLSGRVLVVLAPDDDVAALSFRNLPEVQLIDAGELNAYDILRNDWIVFTRAVLPGGARDAAPSSAGAASPAGAASSVGAASSAGPAVSGGPAADEVLAGANRDEAIDRSGAAGTGGSAAAADDEGSEA